MSEDRTPFTMRLPPKLLLWYGKLATSKGMSRTALIQQVLEGFQLFAENPQEIPAENPKEETTNGEG